MGGKAVPLIELLGNGGMMKPKYLLCPGTVTSQNDGQQHYIGTMALAQLFMVDIRECEIYEPAPWWPNSYYQMAKERNKGMIRLTPRYDGNYTVPNAHVNRRSAPGEEA